MGPFADICSNDEWPLIPADGGCGQFIYDGSWHVIDACNGEDGNSYLFHFDVASRNVYQVNYDGNMMCDGNPSSYFVVGDYSLIHWEEKCSYVSLAVISDGCVAGSSPFDGTTAISYSAQIAD